MDGQAVAIGSENVQVGRKRKMADGQLLSPSTGGEINAR